jgi:4-amino-4-deoxychorismate lyase
LAQVFRTQTTVQSTWSVNGAAAALDPRDRGLAYGDGLFETMAACDGVIRWLDYHLERLAAGCAQLAIPEPANAELRAQIARQTPSRGRAVVKIIVTRGIGARGYRPPEHPVPTIIIGSESWPTPPPEHYASGIEMVTCETRLGENPKLAGLKHLCRLEQVLAQLELRQRGVDEGLLLSTSNHVVSGTSNNVFAVHGACVRTPRIERCGVRGVMRRVVLESCAALGVAAEEADMDPASLRDADEIFVTNALFGVRPVRRLDDVTYAAGPVARRVRALLGAADRD